MKKIYFLALCCILLFSSCDPATWAVVANNSDKSALVEVQFEQDMVNEYAPTYHGFKGFADFYMGYYANTGKLIEIDSFSNKLTIQVAKNDTLSLWGGIHQSKYFSNIRQVKIKSDYRTETVRGRDINKEFEEHEGGLYIYTIK